MRLSQEIIDVPIPGKISSVNVSIGDLVKEGDVLCLLESMKMDIPILAPVDGSVSEVAVCSGQTVRSGDLVAIIEY